MPKLKSALSSSICLAALAALAIGCEEKAEPAPMASAKPQASVPTLAQMVASVRAAENRDASVSADEAQRPKKTLDDCPKDRTVTFDDADFEAAVRLKLQKPQGDIDKADLGRLTSLNLSQVKLGDLDICLFAPMTGLKELFLGPGKYSDLSPIAGATKLETLRASLSQVSNLEPLAKMTKMDRLDLGRTQVSDLTPLAAMKQLTELALDDTPVSDLSPLKDLTQLENLSIKRTRVTDVSMLGGLAKLEFIYVQGTPADDDPLQFAPLRKNGTKVISE